MECTNCGKISMDRNDGFCSTECKIELQQKYKIVRMYFEGYPTRTIKRGLTLEEAQAWCSDPETSSKTAKGTKAVAHFKKYGEWFDGYTEDK